MSPQAKEFSLALDGTTYKVVVDGNSILVNGQPFTVGFEGDKVLVDGTPYDIVLREDQAVVEGIAHSLKVEGLDETSPGPRAATVAVSEGAVTAIMPGKIIRLLVDEGEQVAEGDIVCILEAMKMENELKAPRGGTVTKLYVEAGQDVETGTALVEIE